MKRFLATLSCLHQHVLIMDEEPKIGTKEFCPGCAENHVITRVKPYLDEEVA